MGSEGEPGSCLTSAAVSGVLEEEGDVEAVLAELEELASVVDVDGVEEAGRADSTSVRRLRFCSASLQAAASCCRCRFEWAFHLSLGGSEVLKEAQGACFDAPSILCCWSGNDKGKGGS